MKNIFQDIQAPNNTRSYIRG